MFAIMLAITLVRTMIDDMVKRRLKPVKAGHCSRCGQSTMGTSAKAVKVDGGTYHDGMTIGPNCRHHAESVKKTWNVNGKDTVDITRILFLRMVAIATFVGQRLREFAEHGKIGETGRKEYAVKSKEWNFDLDDCRSEASRKWRTEEWKAIEKQLTE